MEASSRHSIIAAFVLSVQAFSTVQAAITLSPLQFSDDNTSMVVDWTSDNSDVIEYAVFVGEQAGGGEYFSYDDAGAVQPPLTVSGLPLDGSDVYIRMFEIGSSGTWTSQTETSFVSSPSGVSPDNSSGNAENNSPSGVVSLAAGSTVSLSPDSALMIDSGMTIEQFDQVVAGVLMTLATAIGIRFLLKAIT